MVFLLAQLNPYLIFNRGPISALYSKNNPWNIPSGNSEGFMTSGYLPEAQKVRHARHTFLSEDDTDQTSLTGKLHFAAGTTEFDSSILKPFSIFL